VNEDEADHHAYVHVHRASDPLLVVDDWHGDCVGVYRVRDVFARVVVVLVCC
jgi:hypothetical protein